MKCKMLQHGIYKADKDGRIVAWCVGYSDNELKSLLKRHPGWYFSGAKFE